MSPTLTTAQFPTDTNDLDSIAPFRLGSGPGDPTGSTWLHASRHPKGFTEFVNSQSHHQPSITAESAVITISWWHEWFLPPHRSSTNCIGDYSDDSPRLTKARQLCGSYRRPEVNPEEGTGPIGEAILYPVRPKEPLASDVTLDRHSTPGAVPRSLQATSQDSTARVRTMQKLINTITRTSASVTGGPTE